GLSLELAALLMLGAVREVIVMFRDELTKIEPQSILDLCESTMSLRTISADFAREVEQRVARTGAPFQENVCGLGSDSIPAAHPVRKKKASAPPETEAFPPVS